MSLFEVGTIFDNNSISEKIFTYPENVMRPSEETVEEELYFFSDQYHFERLFLYSLRIGDCILLNKMVKQFSQLRLSNLSECPIQEKKFRIVSLLTLITRAAISQGCNPAKAYRLSDKYINKVDQVRSKEGFNPLISELIFEFSFFIRSQSVPLSTEIIKETVDYIYQNLYKDLSNSAISRDLSVHPAYLSSTFKKNVGINLRKFITKVRIDEAKHLLTDTEISLKNISLSLHFSNQSYFCKKFKEETNYTPKQYRSLF